jgi:hypothetical protein
MTQEKTVWGISESESPEHWEGMLGTRTAAVLEGMSIFEGRTFWVVECTQCKIVDAVNGWAILDNIRAWAQDEWGTEDWPDVTEESEDELEELIDDEHLGAVTTALNACLRHGEEP